MGFAGWLEGGYKKKNCEDLMRRFSWGREKGFANGGDGGE